MKALSTNRLQKQGFATCFRWHLAKTLFVKHADVHSEKDIRKGES